MPRGSQILGQAIDEEKWARAKKRAEEEGFAGNWGYVMDIYKKMTHSGEFTPKNIAYRKKKGMKVPEWRAKKKYSPKQYQTAKKAIDLADDRVYTETRIKLVLVKGQPIDEFRCGVCGMLLLRGMHLEKSIIEIKCKRCKHLIVNI